MLGQPVLHFVRDLVQHFVPVRFSWKHIAMFLAKLTSKPRLDEVRDEVRQDEVQNGKRPPGVTASSRMAGEWRRGSESNTPRPVQRADSGFEDRARHQPGCLSERDGT